MMQLIENKDLGLNLENSVNRALLRWIKSLFGIDAINRLYGKVDKENGAKAFIDSVLNELHINVIARGEKPNNAQLQGAMIVVSNYSQGAIDLLVLLSKLLQYRSDVKVIVPEFLMCIEPLCEVFIPANSRTCLTAMKHLRGGGVLLHFPSGAINRPKVELFERNSELWDESIFKIALNHTIPILPCTIYNTNSAKYFISKKLGSAWSSTRTLLEILNKSNSEQLLLFGRVVKSELFGSDTTKSELAEIVKITMALNFLDAAESDEELTKESNNRKECEEILRAKATEYARNGQYVCKLHTLSESKLAMVISDISTDKQLCYLTLHKIGDALSGEGEESLCYYDTFEISRKFTATPQKTLEASAIMPIEQGSVVTVAVAAQKFLVTSLLEYFKQCEKTEYLLTTSIASRTQNSRLRAILSDYISENYLDKRYHKTIIPRVPIGHKTSKITARLSRQIIDTRKFFQYFMRDVDAKNEIFTTDFKLKLRKANKVIGVGINQKSGELSTLLLITK